MENIIIAVIVGVCYLATLIVFWERERHLLESNIRLEEENKQLKVELDKQKEKKLFEDFLRDKNIYVYEAVKKFAEEGNLDWLVKELEYIKDRKKDSDRPPHAT